MLRFTAVALGCALLGSITPQAWAAEGAAPDHHYIPGFRTPRQLGIEIVKNLTPAQRDQLAPDPVVVQSENKPFLLNRSAVDPADPKPRGVVWISMGFIDLVNNLAHAKAIEKIEKGFFEKYVLSLAQESGEQGIKELQGITDDKYWTDDVMNDQLGFFNQIAGTTIAVKLAHHYMGHFHKYVPKMFEGGDQTKPQKAPLNSFITADEWTVAMKAGTRNALDSVASVEGIGLLLEALEKMPQRPEWTRCFIPDKDVVKLSKIRKDLKKMEADFYKGK